MAFAYAEQHKAEIDRLIQQNNPDNINPDPEEMSPENEERFDRELDTMLDRDAELYRRLAQ